MPWPEHWDLIRCITWMATILGILDSNFLMCEIFQLSMVLFTTHVQTHLSIKGGA